VLRGLRLRAFSDSLQSCRPSSFRCFTHSGSSSGHASRCTWKSRSPTPVSRRESITPPTSSFNVRRSDAVGVAFAAPSEAGDRSPTKQIGSVGKTRIISQPTRRMTRYQRAEVLSGGGRRAGATAWAGSLRGAHHRRVVMWAEHCVACTDGTVNLPTTA
jgi:hypothetical protein